MARPKKLKDSLTGIDVAAQAEHVVLVRYGHISKVEQGEKPKLASISPDQPLMRRPTTKRKA